MKISHKPTAVLGIVFLLVLLISAPIAASAKGGRGHHHDPQARLAQLTRELGLSQEQQDELLPILEQQSAEFRSMRERKRAGEDKKTLRAQMHTQQAENAREIEGFLDQSQVEKFRKARAQREERFERKREKRKQRGNEEPAPTATDEPA